MFYESTTFNPIPEDMTLMKLFFLVNRNHREQCSSIPGRMSIKSQFFLLNQKRRLQRD